MDLNWIWLWLATTWLTIPPCTEEVTFITNFTNAEYTEKWNHQHPPQCYTL